MISQSTKYKLYLVLKAVSENEIMVENQRQELGRIEEFEPYSAFKRIEGCSPHGATKNVISPRDMVAFLR